MPEITNPEWDALVSRFPNSHLLQTAAWGDLKAKFGWEFARVATDWAGAQILFKPLPLGLSWAYLPKGPVGQDWEHLWPLVDAECRKRRSVFLKVEPHLWEGESDSVLGWLPTQGFRLSPHEIQPLRTLIVNLEGSEDEILARMKQKTRYNIRLSARKGIVVRTSHDVERFHNLILLTGERETFGVHSQEYYRRAYEHFAPQGQCELFIAEYDGEPLAAVMVFAFGATAWYFYGASSNQHRNLMAPYAAQWEAMRWARSQGCREYDLWGVPDTDLETLEAEFTSHRDGLWGVYRFKRGFGGQLKRGIGVWDRVYNPIVYTIYRLWMKKSQS